MNDFWKSFDIGFLLRSVFAGYLFIISFIVAAEYTELVFVLCFHNKEVISLFLIGSLLAGVSIYTIHRILLYPISLERIINNRRVFLWILRRKCITDDTLEYLLDVWDLEGGESLTSIRYKNTKPWADNTHLMYASSLSIFLGIILGFIISDNNWDWYFFIQNKVQNVLSVFWFLFLIAGVVSDIRLKVVREEIIKKKQMK